MARANPRRQIPARSYRHLYDAEQRAKKLAEMGFVPSIAPWGDGWIVSVTFTQKNGRTVPKERKT